MSDYLRVKVIGSATFIINVLIADGIRVKNVKIINDGCLLNVNYADYEAFCKALKNHNKEFAVIKNRSIRLFVINNVKRIGLYIGLAAIIAFAVFYSTVIDRVNITGNDNVSTQAIMQAVEEVMELPTPKKLLNKSELVKKILSMDGIGSVSVNVVGNTVNIEVAEELPKVEIFDKNNFTDIVAQYDCIVTRVVVYSGAAKVKAGDTVRKGAVVISCDVPTGEDGATTKERANGIIYGRVWVTDSTIYTPIVMQRYRTGNVKTLTSLKWNEKSISRPFSDYDVEKRNIILDNAIPLPLIVTTYYETKTRETEFDFDANKDGLIKARRDFLEKNFPADGKVLRMWYNTKRLDKITQLDIYYELETKITS